MIPLGTFKKYIEYDWVKYMCKDAVAYAVVTYTVVTYAVVTYTVVTFYCHLLFKENVSM